MRVDSTLINNRYFISLSTLLAYCSIIMMMGIIIYYTKCRYAIIVIYTVYAYENKKEKTNSMFKWPWRFAGIGTTFFLNIYLWPHYFDVRVRAHIAQQLLWDAFIMFNCKILHHRLFKLLHTKI